MIIPLLQTLGIAWVGIAAFVLFVIGLFRLMYKVEDCLYNRPVLKTLAWVIFWPTYLTGALLIVVMTVIAVITLVVTVIAVMTSVM